MWETASNLHFFIKVQLIIIVSEGGLPIKGESSGKTPPPAKKSLFSLGSNLCTSKVAFSALFAPVISLL